MDKRVKYFVRRRNPAGGGMRKTPLTPEEIAKFKILKKQTGKALERRLPAWARAKQPARFSFAAGQKAKYPSWTYRQAPAPAELKIPDPRRAWTPAAYIKEFNRLNGLKQNPSSRKDYIKVAAAFKHARGVDPQGMWAFLLTEMADYFAADNPRFDRERFYHAAGASKTNPARVRTTARYAIKKYGKRRARRMAGELIDAARTPRMKKHYGKLRRAINPRVPVYEIQANKRWIPVTSHIFRSWAGNRRKNGKVYRGPRYYLGTNTLYKK